MVLIVPILSETVNFNSSSPLYLPITMIKELMHDPIFLAGKSEVATKEDLQVAQDLLDTLLEHKETCVGMAANMIGVRKRIIAFLDESGRADRVTPRADPEKDTQERHGMPVSNQQQPVGRQLLPAAPRR